VLRVIPVDLVHVFVRIADPFRIELSLLVSDLIALIVEHLVLVLVIIVVLLISGLSVEHFFLVLVVLISGLKWSIQSVRCIFVHVPFLIEGETQEVVEDVLH
jgi:hypothetical protein